MCHYHYKLGEHYSLMRQKIKSICKQIEQEHNIRILFAVENGSRAWRMESADSDYDVRFVFIRPLQDYIQLQELPEVLNYFFDKGGQPCTRSPYLDLSGFDIFKFLTLLSSSNPTTIEWLTTDIVYHGKQPKLLQHFALKNFDPRALFYHYQSLCKANYSKYISSNTDVTHKRYLYTLRGLINAKWVKAKNSVPPISLLETLQKIGTEIPTPLLQLCKEIIAIKKQGKEKEKIDRMIIIDEYVERFLEEQAPPAHNQPPRDVLGKFLQKMIINQKNLK